jgi:hypothetical protein
MPYILESNPHPNLIRTSFCRFLKRKKSYFAVLIRTFHNDSVISDEGESDE